MSAQPFPYLVARQTRDGEPTAYQQELANAIEAIFAKGSWDLPELLHGLNTSRIRPPTGGEWTPDNFKSLMQELGA